MSIVVNSFVVVNFVETNVPIVVSFSMKCVILLKYTVVSSFADSRVVKSSPSQLSTNYLFRYLI